MGTINFNNSLAKTAKGIISIVTPSGCRCRSSRDS